MNALGRWIKSCRDLLFSGDLVDVGFRFAILGKGLSGLFEMIGSALLFFLNPTRMNRLLTFLAHRLFSTWPWQPVANILLHFGMHFSTNAQIFGILYLLSHGVIKCILMLLLWRKKLWAYPLAILSILLFMAYQIDRICIRPTVMMVALTVFDAAMIGLTVVEYRRVRRLFRAKKRECPEAGH
ncbi:MAG: DUF2127 domain-containing protein [Ethanoligenens sp.]